MDDQPSSEALETTAYLARSENRVRLLDALREDSRMRRDLVDETGVSSATVGRVLTEFQSRGWAERTQDGYVATPAGKLVLDEFEPFVGSIAAIQQLGDAVDWIPADDLAVDLQHFTDAVVRRPDRHDPVEITDFFIDLLEETTELRVFTHLVPIEAKEHRMLDGLRSGRLDLSIVATEGLLEYLASHPDHRDRQRAILEAGCTLSCYRDEIPCNMFVFDDLVMIADSYSEGENPYASIMSENPAVLEWAQELFDLYERRAERVPANFFDGEVAESVEADREEPPTSVE